MAREFQVFVHPLDAVLHWSLVYLGERAAVGHMDYSVSPGFRRAPHRVFRRRYSRGPRCIRQDVNSRRDPEAELTEHAIQINPSPRAIAGSLRFVTLIRRFYHLDVSGRGEY
jgi:hypothetical protein